MTVPIYKGRKVNKVLCLSFLLVTVILLMTAGIFAFLKKSAVCDTFCILALISGAFSLLYGTLWLIYGLKEKKTERELNEFFGRQNMPVDPARPDYREFFLPEERLKGMSRKRFRSVLRHGSQSRPHRSIRNRSMSAWPADRGQKSGPCCSTPGQTPLCSSQSQCYVRQ